MMAVGVDPEQQLVPLAFAMAVMVHEARSH
jgi:hypothetical protein